MILLINISQVIAGALLTLPQLRFCLIVEMRGKYPGLFNQAAFTIGFFVFCFVCKKRLFSFSVTLEAEN